MLAPGDGQGADVCSNSGSDEARYLAPVSSGGRIRSVNTLKGIVEQSPGRILVTNHGVVEVEGEATPAFVADILYLAFTGA